MLRLRSLSSALLFDGYIPIATRIAQAGLIPGLNGPASSEACRSDANKERHISTAVKPPHLEFAKSSATANVLSLCTHVAASELPSSMAAFGELPSREAFGKTPAFGIQEVRDSIQDIAFGWMESGVL